MALHLLGRWDKSNSTPSGDRMYSTGVPHSNRVIHRHAHRLTCLSYSPIYGLSVGQGFVEGSGELYRRLIGDLVLHRQDCRNGLRRTRIEAVLEKMSRSPLRAPSQEFSTTRRSG